MSGYNDLSGNQPDKNTQNMFNELTNSLIFPPDSPFQSFHQNFQQAFQQPWMNMTAWGNNVPFDANMHNFAQNLNQQADYVALDDEEDEGLYDDGEEEDEDGGGGREAEENIVSPTHTRPSLPSQTFQSAPEPPPTPQSAQNISTPNKIPNSHSTDNGADKLLALRAKLIKQKEQKAKLDAEKQSASPQTAIKTNESAGSTDMKEAKPPGPSVPHPTANSDQPSMPPATNPFPTVASETRIHTSTKPPMKLQSKPPITSHHQAVSSMDIDALLSDARAEEAAKTNGELKSGTKQLSNSEPSKGPEPVSNRTVGNDSSEARRGSGQSSDLSEQGEIRDEPAKQAPNSQPPSNHKPPLSLPEKPPTSLPPKSTPKTLPQKLDSSQSINRSNPSELNSTKISSPLNRTPPMKSRETRDDRQQPTSSTTRDDYRDRSFQKQELRHPSGSRDDYYDNRRSAYDSFRPEPKARVEIPPAQLHGRDDRSLVPLKSRAKAPPGSSISTFNNANTAIPSDAKPARNNPVLSLAPRRLVAGTELSEEAPDYEEISEWLQMTGFYDGEFRKKLVARRRKVLELMRQCEELEMETQQDLLHRIHARTPSVRTPDRIFSPQALQRASMAPPQTPTTEIQRNAVITRTIQNGSNEDRGMQIKDLANRTASANQTDSIIKAADGTSSTTLISGKRKLSKDDASAQNGPVEKLARKNSVDGNVNKKPPQASPSTILKPPTSTSASLESRISVDHSANRRDFHQPPPPASISGPQRSGSRDSRRRSPSPAYNMGTTSRRVPSSAAVGGADMHRRASADSRNGVYSPLQRPPFHSRDPSPRGDGGYGRNGDALMYDDGYYDASTSSSFRGRYPASYRAEYDTHPISSYDSYQGDRRGGYGPPPPLPPPPQSLASSSRGGRGRGGRGRGGYNNGRGYYSRGGSEG
ncbi:hypothetical protein MMC25_007048 [Agyrium rufum]|nr:hypothetical protein [Agyrium rufum]